MTNPNGRFGIHGGQYIPETLMNAVIELEEAYNHYKNDPEFNRELTELLNEYAGRPSRLYYAKKMTEDLGGAKIYLKREDLNHTGAHKINNVLGQALLAKKMGKTRLIAETGAGQHGVATATAAALLGMELPDKISAYIAENVTANVRQLEGTINKILAYKDLLGNDTDEETVTRAIQDMLRRSNEYVPTPEAILEYISKYYSLDESVIRGQQRVRDAVSARQIAMYLIRSMTNLSLDEIGKVFDNRDHSTVLYSIQQIEKKMKKDAAFAEMVKEIKTNINSKR